MAKSKRRSGSGAPPGGVKPYDRPEVSKSSKGRKRGGKKKRIYKKQENASIIDDTFSIEIQASLESLIEDGERSGMSFPAIYDGTQRKQIRTMAEKLGLFSKSTGKKGKGRFIHVDKVMRDADLKEVSLRVAPVLLNSSTVEWFPPLMLEYMEKYPAPGKKGTLDPWSAQNLRPLASDFKQKKERRGRPVFQPLPKGSKKTIRKAMREIPAATSKLPVFGYREQIMELVERNQVIVLSADTGCGKSTQIPQFLLDDALARGREDQTRIICTQPRRISATSLAQRVAKERSGTSGANPKEVGHAIRFDSSYDATRSKLIFCTTGTLLTWLKQDPLALGFSHIVLDEVHERDQFTDFLLVLIKTSILKQRPGLKVILMSATIQVQKFSDYFQPDFPAPVLKMSGGTNFPVTTLFLEDILALLEIDLSSPIQTKKAGHASRINDASTEDVKTALSNLKCLMCGNSGIVGDEEFVAHVANCSGKPGVAFGVQDSLPIKKNVPSMGDVLLDALSSVDDLTKNAMLSAYMSHISQIHEFQAVDYDMLLQLLYVIDRTFPLPEDGKGAILVFLPGWEEISTMERALLQNPKNAAAYEIALLHSRLTTQEQQSAFMIPPPGKRKIVLSTNIAETSLTIEDVVFVVDCGKSKQTHALATTSSSSFVMGLQTTWVSRANCVQRTGRAGRVREGICFRLFSKARFETAMKEFQLPELLTTPLEELLLQLKLLQFGQKLQIEGAKEFLLAAMDAPSVNSIDASLQRLVDMGALTESKTDSHALTLMGLHMAKICSAGVDMQMAKLLLWGHTFGCFEAILQTTGTLSGYRNPFVGGMKTSPADKLKVEQSKKAFAQNGSPPNLMLQSDHFVLWKAFEAYLGTSMTRSAFCKQHMMDRFTMIQIASIYKQLKRGMKVTGLSPETQLISMPVSKPTATIESVASYLMALSIGMYPKALFSGSESLSRKWTSKEKVQVKISGDSMVERTINSKSLEHQPAERGSPDEWMVYHEMMQTRNIRIAKCGTKLPSALLPALFMGSVETQVLEEQEGEEELYIHMDMDYDDSMVTSKWSLVLDDWIVFELSNGHEAHWVTLLRERLHAVFNRHLGRLHAISQYSSTKFSAAEKKLKKHDAELLQALVAWVSSDLQRKKQDVNKH